LESGKVYYHASMDILKLMRKNLVWRKKKEGQKQEMMMTPTEEGVFIHENGKDLLKKKKNQNHMNAIFLKVR